MSRFLSLCLLLVPSLLGACASGPSTPGPSPAPGAATGADCGGLAGLACPAGAICRYAPEAQCGAADRTGTCVERPEACAEIYSPVCGCDGKTYGNECEALREGVSIASEGACGEPVAVPSDPTVSTEARSCGGRRRDAAEGLCPAGEFCDYAPEAICGRADATGTCRTKPEICTREYRPVCGCDGKTYGNRCSAHAAGTSVDREGECRASSGPIAPHVQRG